jgi:hypothetical protein
MQGFPNFVGQFWSYDSGVLTNISLVTQLFHIFNFNEGSIAPYYSFREQLGPPNSEDVRFEIK